MYLHSSRTFGRGERDQLERLRGLGYALPDPDRRRLGAVVGRVRLVDCRLMEDGDWPAALAEPRSGRLWAWVLADPKALRKPIQVPGQRNLFEVNGA
jgi:hypothetical protein